GRWPRAGLRDQPQLPQRGHRRDPRPRVHHARALPGLRDLRGPDDPHPRAAGRPRGAPGRRHTPRLPWAGAGPRSALAAAAGPRSGGGGHRGSGRSTPRSRDHPCRCGEGGGHRAGRNGARGAPHGGVRPAGGADARAADLRHAVPGRGLATRAAERARSALRGSLRADRRAHGAGQRVLRADGSGRPARPLRGAAPGPGGGRRRSARDGRGLRARPRPRSPAHRRRGDRHRRPGHAAHRGRLHPGGHPLPAAPSGDRDVSWELFVGLRYLRARRRVAFLSLISLISLLGVTIGVATLNIVLAVMTGFEQDLRDKILGFNPHIVVVSYSGALAADQGLVEQVRAVPGVVAAAPFVYGQAMLTGGRDAWGVVVRGIDPEAGGAVVDVERHLDSGSFAALASPQRVTLPPEDGGTTVELPGLLIGAELARQLGVTTGSVVSLVSPL